MTMGKAEFPMCFTLRAHYKFMDRYGSMTGCFNRTEELAKSGQDRELLEEYLWMTETLLECGYWKAIADGEEAADPPEKETLMAALTLPELKDLVVQALLLGGMRQVSAEPPKNAGGAEAEGQAPNS